MIDTKRAKTIIEKILYINIATASNDGVPWNTPVYSAYDQNYNFFWTSDKNGQHSKNIRDNGQIFITIYDSTVSEGKGEGVYIKARAVELDNVEAIKEAAKFLYTRKNQSPNKHAPEEFLGDYPRRVYKAVPEQFWVNGQGEVNGNYIDTRVEIKL